MYIVKEKAVEAKAYGFRGFGVVQHTPKRCCRKGYRTYHWYNYHLINGKKIGTVELKAIELLFITNVTGFAQEYLEFIELN